MENSMLAALAKTLLPFFHQSHKKNTNSHFILNMHKHCFSLKKNLYSFFLLFFFPFQIQMLLAKTSVMFIFGNFLILQKEGSQNKKAWQCEKKWIHLRWKCIKTFRLKSLSSSSQMICMSVNKRQPFDSRLKQMWYVVLRCCITYRSADLYEWLKKHFNRNLMIFFSMNFFMFFFSVVDLDTLVDGLTMELQLLNWSHRSFEPIACKHET